MWPQPVVTAAESDRRPEDAAQETEREGPQTSGVQGGCCVHMVLREPGQDVKDRKAAQLLLCLSSCFPAAARPSGPGVRAELGQGSGGPKWRRVSPVSGDLPNSPHLQPSGQQPPSARPWTSHKRAPSGPDETTPFVHLPRTKLFLGFSRSW